MKSILDPTFDYVPSHLTDIRKTFARVRREMRHENAGDSPVVAGDGAAGDPRVDGRVRPRGLAVVARSVK